MLLPCIPCKYCQCFIFIPAHKAVAFSGSVRECDIGSGDDLCAVRPHFPVIIEISEGDRLFCFPFRIEVKVICQVYFLPRCIIRPASVRLCVPADKIIAESYDISHEGEKRFLIHDGYCVPAGILIRVGTHIAGPFRVVIGIITDKISFRRFRKVEVFSPLFRTVIRAVPWELLRACVLMVQRSIHQHPARLYHIRESPKDESRIALKIFIEKDGCACVVKIEDIARLCSHRKVIFHDNIP